MTRTEVEIKVAIDGKPHTMYLVENPTIDDVVAIEMRLTAADIQNGVPDATRRVGRDVRDVLIRIGVDR